MRRARRKRSYLVGLLDAAGKRPYPACEPRRVRSLRETIEFPACAGVDAVVKYVSIDGRCWPLDREVVLKGTLLPFAPRFPAGSIRDQRCRRGRHVTR